MVVVHLFPHSRLCDAIAETVKIAKIGSYLSSPAYRFPELRCKAPTLTFLPICVRGARGLDRLTARAGAERCAPGCFRCRREPGRPSGYPGGALGGRVDAPTAPLAPDPSLHRSATKGNDSRSSVFDTKREEAAPTGPRPAFVLSGPSSCGGSGAASPLVFSGPVVGAGGARRSRGGPAHRLCGGGGPGRRRCRRRHTQMDPPP
jgi:hypothetical protein